MARTRVPHEVDVEKIKENASTPEIQRFAETFNSILSGRRIHQDDLAGALGISTGSVSSYRNGKKEPRLSMILKIADYLNVDCNYLLRGVSSDQLDIYDVTALSPGAISQLKNTSPQNRQKWGRVLSDLITHPWILDALHAYLYLNIDRVAKWDEEVRASGGYKATDNYERRVALADSKRGEIVDVDASVLDDALLLAVEGELRKLKAGLQNPTQKQ